MLEEKMSFFKALAENAGRSGAVGRWTRLHSLYSASYFFSFTASIHFSFPDLTALSKDPEFKFPAGAPILAKAVDQGV